MRAAAEAVAIASPAVVETERDLVRAALEGEAAARPGIRSPLFGGRRIALWAAGVLVLAGIAALSVPRPSKSARLLDVVEAAVAQQATHSVGRAFDTSGALVERSETWVSASGGYYSEVRHFPAGTLETHTNLCGPSNRIEWRKTPGANEYALGWTAGNLEAPAGVSPPATDASVPGVRSVQVLWTLAMLRAAHALITTHESTGQLHGQQVRIVDVTARAPAHPSAVRMVPPQWDMRFYLSRDGSRLLGEVETLAPSTNPEHIARFEVWPIEYGPEPPASLFEVHPPKGARLTFDHELIDRTWESMSDEERKAIRETADGFLRAWSAGDFNTFNSYCDFAAGLAYAAKARFTAQDIREGCRDLVAEQTKRFADQQWTVDYAYGTTRPPGALYWWNLARTNPRGGEGWTFLRERPSEEPGIVVLAHGRVTTRDRQVGYSGTYLFLKRIGGVYKVVLWAPPFGGFGY